jgi:hypothetical protein
VGAGVWLLAALPASAQTRITGKIESKTPLTDNKFQLSISNERGQSEFLVDQSTLIQALVSADDIEVGQKIMVPGPAKPPGQGLITNPSQIPKVPKVPQVPSVPQVPKIPNLGASPPGGGQAPPPGGGAAGAGGAGAPAGAGGGPSAAKAGLMQGMPADLKPGEKPPQASEGMGKPKPPPAELPPIPGSDPLAEMGATPLSKTGAAPKAAAKPAPPAPSGSRVISLKKADNGIQVEFEAAGGKTETVVIPAAGKVRQVLSPEDLKKNMAVDVEVHDAAPQPLARTVTVLPEGGGPAA